MKLTKRIFSLALVLLMLLCICPATVSAEETAGVFTLKTIGQAGTASFHYRVIKCDTSASGEVTIPSVYGSDNVPVTEIYAKAFDDCNAVTQVNVPASVTKLFDGVFSGCMELEKVVFEAGTSAVTFGNNVFEGCEKMTGIALPATLTSIPEDTFSGCESLMSVTIPDTVTSIGAEAFYACTSLKNMRIPASVTEIGEKAFSFCDGLTAFDVASANNNYCSVSGVLFSKDCKTLIAYPASASDSNYDIPDGTEEISEDAFLKVANLHCVKMPSSLKAIGAYAFSQAPVLESVTLNEGLETIGSCAFQRCPNLKSITIPSTVTAYDGAFFASGLETAVINGAKVISNGAFDSCESLTTVTAKDGLEKIEAGAFKDCTALTDVILPLSVSEINDKAFIDANEGVSITAPFGSEAISYAQENDMEYSVQMPDFGIKNNTGKYSLSYREGITLTAENTNNCSVKWYSVSGSEKTELKDNGKTIFIDGDEITIKEIKSGMQLVAEITADGETLSDTETIECDTGFFKKLVAFFKGIFGKLTVHVQ